MLSNLPQCRPRLEGGKTRGIDQHCPTKLCGLLTVRRPGYSPDAIRVPLKNLNQLKLPPPCRVVTSGLSRQWRLLGAIKAPAVDVHRFEGDLPNVCIVACLARAQFGRQLGCASGVQSCDEVASGWSIWRICSMHDDPRVVFSLVSLELAKVTVAHHHRRSASAHSNEYLQMKEAIAAVARVP